jgi:hypothetical protein
MRKLLTTLIFTFTLLCAGLQSAYAQTPGTPDCLIPFDTGAGVGASTYNFPGGNGFDNRAAGCVTWTLQWQSNATATVTFQSSLGVAAPSSYGTYTGTTVFSGTGIMTFSNLVTGTVVDTPWVRVNVVTSATGQTKGVLYGYKTGTTGGTGGGGGGGGGSGCTAPCVVIGPDAPGAVPTQSPVQMSAFDGTDVRRVNSDTNGLLNVNVKSSVAPVGRTTFSSGQAAVTGTAANLGTNTSKSVCVEAFIGNTITVYAGATGVTTSTGVPLNPGQGYCWDVANTNLIFVVASTTGASVGWSLTN